MRAAFAACLSLAIALAGCVSDDVDPDDEDEGTEPVVGAGSVSGEVRDTNLNAIRDARIRLILDDEIAHETHTDSNGVYNITNVAPETYRIQAFAPHCCDTELEELKVAPHEDVVKPFLLELKIPETGDPYSDGPFEGSGFISCSVTTPTQPVYPCQPYDSEHQLEAGDTVERPGLQTLHVGLRWDSETPLNLSVYNNVGGSNLLKFEVGTSPIEIRLDNDDIEDEDLRFDQFYDRDMPLRFAVTPGEIGVIYQQTFTIYWSYHFWEEAPSSYSTIPDI